MDLPGADCGISPLSVQHKYVRKALPVIISQLAKDWPLRHECTLEALRYVHGDTKVCTIALHSFMMSFLPLLILSKSSRFSDTMRMAGQCQRGIRDMEVDGIAQLH